MVHDRLVGLFSRQNNELKCWMRMHLTCIRHAHQFRLARQARKKAAASSRWQAAFCNFLPPSGGRIKPTPPTSVEKESA